MELKLAQYNLETGKFDRLLELASPILIPGYVDEYYEFKNGFLLTKGAVEVFLESDNTISESIYFKDEKDPLNRFNGIFDGRTYGEGKFVLIDENSEFLIKTIYKD
jgi:hypothetical protein